MRWTALLMLFFVLIPNAWALNVSMSIKTEGGNKPAVIGKTNLPDGTDVMVSISRKESSYSGQAKAKVTKGEFRTASFTQKGAPFNPGIYKLEVTVPYAPTQPASVKAIIGEHGERLQGNLVKKSALGKYAVYRTTFKIGGTVSAEKDKVARQQDKRDVEEWKNKNCKDICITLQVQSGMR